MKNNILEYKGYHTKIEFDTETYTLRGKIEGINDLVNFESSDGSRIEKEFHDAVDDYLEFCKEVGKDPDKEYRGIFNVRINPELHKKLALKAYENGESLNATVEKAIQEYLTEYSETNSQLQKTIKILSNMLETKGMYNSEKTLPIETESKIIPFNKATNVNMQYKQEEKVK